MKKDLLWLKVVGIMACAFLCVCWVAALKNTTNVSWSEMIWFFAVTYALLSKYNGVAGYAKLVAWSVCGAIIIPLIVILTCWPDGSASLIFPVASVVGILLAALCHYKKGLLMFVISAAIMVLFNSFVVDAWLRMIN